MKSWKCSSLSYRKAFRRHIRLRDHLRNIGKLPAVDYAPFSLFNHRFKARAEIIKTALGGRGYKLQRLNVAQGYNGPQPRLAMAARGAMSADVAAPNLEAGVSMLTVNANGAIEVLE